MRNVDAVEFYYIRTPALRVLFYCNNLLSIWQAIRTLPSKSFFALFYYKVYYTTKVDYYEVTLEKAATVDAARSCKI